MDLFPWRSSGEIVVVRWSGLYWYGRFVSSVILAGVRGKLDGSIRASSLYILMENWNHFYI